MARKEKPGELKVIARNPGKRPIQNTEQIEAPGKLEPESPPDWLNEEQKEIWRIGLENAPKGVLKKIDTAIFLIWVVACDRFTKANIELEVQNLVLTGAMGGPIANPLIGIANKQSDIMIKAASEMGFTPSSRSRVGHGGGATKENPFLNNGNRSS